jgi:hypothetical protein
MNPDMNPFDDLDPEAWADAVPQIVRVMQQLRVNLEQHNAALEDERGPADPDEAERFDRMFGSDGMGWD